MALILSERPNRELFSEQSVIISTHAAGVPSSEPASVRATAVDHARISVSWEPGAFPNGKIQSYDLRIVELVAPGMKGYEAVQVGVWDCVLFGRLNSVQQQHGDMAVADCSIMVDCSRLRFSDTFLYRSSAFAMGISRWFFFSCK